MSVHYKDKELLAENKDKELIKLTLKDFISICLAQYSILLPLGIGILFIYFLIVLFITKVWF